MRAISPIRPSTKGELQLKRLKRDRKRLIRENLELRAELQIAKSIACVAIESARKARYGESFRREPIREFDRNSDGH